MTPDQTTKWTWQKTARRGAELGAVLSVAYAFLFDAYAIGSGSIGNTTDTISANTISVFSQTIPWTVAMLILAALIGALTALLIRTLLPRLNPSSRPGRSMLYGFGITIVVVVLVTLIAAIAGAPMAFNFNPQTYMFWVGLPALLYVAAGAVGAERLSTT